MRKKVLRKMKKLLRRIGEHARRHRDLLEARQAATCYSTAQADRILARIDEKLELLPQVIEQAHERIIGERKVDMRRSRRHGTYYHRDRWPVFSVMDEIEKFASPPDGEALSPGLYYVMTEHGFPLRVTVPRKWGYKHAKHVALRPFTIRIQF